MTYCIHGILVLSQHVGPQPAWHVLHRPVLPKMGTGGVPERSFSPRIAGIGCARLRPGYGPRMGPPSLCRAYRFRPGGAALFSWLSCSDRGCPRHLFAAPGSLTPPPRSGERLAQSMHSVSHRGGRILMPLACGPGKQGRRLVVPDVETPLSRGQWTARHAMPGLAQQRAELSPLPDCHSYIACLRWPHELIGRPGIEPETQRLSFGLQPVATSFSFDCSSAMPNTENGTDRTHDIVCERVGGRIPPVLIAWYRWVHWKRARRDICQRS